MWYWKKSIPVFTLVMHEASCTFLLYELETHTPFSVKAVERYEAYHSIINGLIFQWHQLVAAIIHFLRKNNVHGTYTFTIVVDNTQVSESFVVSAVPLRQNELSVYEGHQMSTTAYIGPYNDGDHVLYQAVLSQSTLLHYKLLAHYIRASLVAITAPQCALMYAYRGIEQANFRRARLVKEIMEQKGTCEYFFTKTLFERTIEVPIDYYDKYAKSILMAYGYSISHRFSL